MTTFGGFSVDGRRRTLAFHGDPVRLTSKEFDLLCLLLAGAGRIVTKDEIVYSAWPDAAASDASLAQAVYRLRKTLARYEPEHEFISTIPGRGYQFTATVESSGAAGRAPVPAQSAFALYRNAMRHLDARTDRSLRTAIELFDAALREQPDYAAALVGLAQSHAYLAEYSFAAPREAFVAAKAAALAALRIDRNDADAYAVLGDVLLFYERDWAGAGAAYATARSIAPYSTTTMLLSAWHSLIGGDPSVAIAHLTAALTLAPTSPLLNTAFAAISFLGRRDTAALRVLDDVLAFDPDFALALLYSGLIHTAEGRWDAAERCLWGVAEEAFAPQARSLLCYTVARRGDATHAEYLLRAFEKSAEPRSWECHRALALLGLGRVDECLRALHAACDASEPEVVLLGVNPLFAELSTDRRFHAVLEHARTKAKLQCESCGLTFEPAEPRFACSYNCTYCARCTRELSGTCANCGGPLGQVTKP